MARATGGTLVRGDGSTAVGSFAIDSRRLEPGGMFVALRGSRTDGHTFLGEAAEHGAAAALVQYVPGPDEPAPPALLRVPEAVKALGRAGALARNQCRATKFLAVTGSSGKTTTKEFIAAGLAEGHRVHRTSGNFNNHLGVPLTLLACPDDAEMAVIEMGMSAPLEIAALAEMARPDVGLVTNVSAAHLENFRSIDDIAAAKGELFAMLGDDGVSVVNLDDDQVRVQAQRHKGKQVTFGSASHADVRLEEIEDRFLPGAALTFRHDGKRQRLELAIGGAHAARNALAALATVVAAGADVEQAMQGMAKVEASAGRGKTQKLDQGMLLIDDSYNSNPAAMASVIGTLASTPVEGRRILVMGDMLELGPESPAMHREVGKAAAQAGLDVLFAVGKLSLLAAETARRAGVPQVHHQPDARDAASDLPECVRPGDAILVKGSRSMKLEMVVKALQRAYGGAA
ncbi:hypothetical protein ABI59_12970 [Acidobacteria bacterium Mor1]|nr:hypothetical protein ABI59_12970 [Acidobacteria bacterium Mor1]